MLLSGSGYIAAGNMLRIMTTSHPPFHIVLIEPEIPPNTGNIARLCGATRTVLDLVGKLGFSIDDKHLKRAGLDYWHTVEIRQWASFAEISEAFPNARFWYTSKKSGKSYVQAEFLPGDFLVFGKESLGLPDDLLQRHPEQSLRIPILSPSVRSLNLANAAAIILYEALRQTGQLGE